MGIQHRLAYRSCGNGNDTGHTSTYGEQNQHFHEASHQQLHSQTMQINTRLWWTNLCSSWSINSHTASSQSFQTQYLGNNNVQDAIVRGGCIRMLYVQTQFLQSQHHVDNRVSIAQAGDSYHGLLSKDVHGNVTLLTTRKDVKHRTRAIPLRLCLEAISSCTKRKQLRDLLTRSTFKALKVLDMHFCIVEFLLQVIDMRNSITQQRSFVHLIKGYARIVSEQSKSHSNKNTRTWYHIVQR